MKKMVESALPLKEINASSMRERVRQGHPGNLLLWWNRTPVDSTAALLFAALMDEPEAQDEREALRELIRGLAEGDKEAYRTAGQMLKQKNQPLVVDSFCGFGGIALAAEKLGLNAEASDLNAAAVLLSKAACEVPPRFAGIAPAHPGASFEKKPGYAALAEDIEYYGNWMLEKAKSELQSIVPEAESGTPFAWLWVRTVECPNPACKCRMPLSSSYILSKAKGREYWAEPVADGQRIAFRVHRGICPKGKESGKLEGKGARFVCPLCGAPASEDYIRQQGNAGGMGMRMMAVALQRDGAKIFIAPDATQEAAADVPPSEDRPTGSIPQNSRWFAPPLYGMTEYADLYTPRQLRTLCGLCDWIPRVQIKAASDALAAGMSPEGGALESGGAGALAYGQAIGVYLALAVCKMANFYSSMCSWDNRTGTGRAAFCRQAIPMAWTFAEGNPFSDGTGNFGSMLSQVTEAVRNLPEGGAVRVVQRDAVTLDYPKGSVVCTELPWYDNVGYADLSDYFYIWMRRCLKETEPELFDKIVTSKEELCSIPEHYGNDAARAKEAYEARIETLIVRMADAVTEDCPSLLFYLYTPADERAIRSEESKDRGPAPLEHLLNCLLEKGCRITALWPVRTDKPGEGNESVRIAIVFRARARTAEAATRRKWIAALKRELPERMPLCMECSDNDRDRMIAALGVGLDVFSRHKKIINADGSDMRLRDALFLIAQEARAYLESALLEQAPAGREERGTGHAGEL